MKQRKRNAAKGERINAVVKWGLNLAAIGIFGIVKHWPTTSMRGVHTNEPREKERPATGLRREGKTALNRWYIGSVHKFHRWVYEGVASWTNIDAPITPNLKFICSR